MRNVRWQIVYGGVLDGWGSSVLLNHSIFLFKSLSFERIIELFPGGCFIVADTMYDIRFFPPRGQSSRKGIVRLSTNQEAHYPLWITQANHDEGKIVLKGENCARRARKTRSQNNSWSGQTKDTKRIQINCQSGMKKETSRSPNLFFQFSSRNRTKEVLSQVWLSRDVKDNPVTCLLLTVGAWTDGECRTQRWITFSFIQLGDSRTLKKVSMFFSVVEGKGVIIFKSNGVQAYSFTWLLCSRFWHFLPSRNTRQMLPG